MSPSDMPSDQDAQQNHVASPHILHEFKSIQLSYFLSVYDDKLGLIEDRWIYNYNLLHGRTDEDLAAYFSYLGHESMALCMVEIQPGTLIGCIGEPGSNRILAYRLYSHEGVRFYNERILPGPPHRKSPITQPRLTYDFLVEQETAFVRLYDNQTSYKAEPWLYSKGGVEGKTPDELRAFFCLPYTPKFICDVVVPPHERAEAWILPNHNVPMSYQIGGRLTFSNERQL